MNDEGKKKRVIAASEKNGFNLEFIVSNELKKAKYAVTPGKILNTLGLMHLSKNKIIEIDVVGINKALRDPLHLVIECKGAKSDTILILVKTDDSTKKEDFNEINAKDNNACRYFLPFNNRLPIFNFEDKNVNYTYTGDFFLLDKQNQDAFYRKASKSDDQNNFYKAQVQIAESIMAYDRFLSDSKSSSSQNDTSNYILPLIVTNAEIWVVDYSQEPTDASGVDMALHRIVNRNLNLKLKPEDEENSSCFAIPVINIRYLSKLLSKVVAYIDSNLVGNYNKISLN